MTILVCTFICSCENEVSKTNQTELKIRIENLSQFDYKNIRVNPSNGVVNYGDLEAGQSSEYQVFELAYAYAFIELEIEGKTYTIQPIDYVGATPLKNGEYSYQIDANDLEMQYEKLVLKFMEN